MPDPTEYKRIRELPSTTIINADDTLAVDGLTGGSRNISWPDLLDLIIGEAEDAEAGAIAAAAAAGTARDLAIAAKNAADADAVATAADRVQTGLDRTATAADRVQTGLDRTQTGTDRTAVASDKATVAADKATVAADKATVTTLKTAADADAVATAADRVQTGLDKTATAADRVQTGLDRTQTGSDRTASSGSATAAAASATAAAASQTAAATSGTSAASSATTALNAIAQAFKGGVAGASVPATSPLAGDYYRITSAGTSQSKTWAIGDAAIYNGTSGSWTQLTGFFNAVASTYDPIVAQRTALDQIISDGNTSNRAQIQVPGSRGNVSGMSGTLTWRGLVTVPSSNPGTQAEVFVMGPSYPTVTGNANALGGAIYTNGSFYIRQVSTGSNWRDFAYSGFRAAYSGTTGILEVVFTAGTGNPVVYWNGVDISSNFSAAGNTGTPPPWLDSSLTATYHLTGLNWPADVAPLGCWIMGSLSAAERLAWQITGKPPAWVAQGGHANYSLGLGGSIFANISYSTFSGASATGFSAVSSTAITSLAASTAGGGLGITLIPGQTVKLSFTVTLNSGQLPSVQLSDNSGTGIGGSTTCTAGLNTVSVTVPVGAALPATAGWGVQFRSTSTTDYSVSGLAIQITGALSLPSVMPCRVIDDVTFIGSNQARLSIGMWPVTNRRDWRIIAATATNGNEQLLGGNVLLDIYNTKIASWTVFNVGTATRTVSLGFSSGGLQFANAVSVAASLVTPTAISLASTLLTSATLWCASNGTDRLVHTITGHRLERF